MASYENRRKYERIKIKKMSKLNDTNCEIINISKDGMMLTGELESSESHVEVQLKIGGNWVNLQGTTMWVMNKPSTQIKRIGIFITQAPPQYKDFIDNLYLEAHQEK
ncbi:MAG: PilZ domain-containing protein [bacterium]|nr:PilZ domain-containing protein [bacterium]